MILSTILAKLFKFVISIKIILLCLLFLSHFYFVKAKLLVLLCNKIKFKIRLNRILSLNYLLLFIKFLQKYNFALK